MKKKKQSGFRQQQKRLTKESKGAALAIRELYEDQNFQSDFDEICAIAKESCYGKDVVPETVRVKLFPEGDTGFVVENVTREERIGFYQEVGLELGKSGRQMVSVFRYHERVVTTRAGAPPALVVSASTIDHRVMSSIFSIVRDSNGKIQNFIHEGDAHDGNKHERVIQDANSAPDVSAFVVGYGFGLRDKMLTDLIKK